MQVETDQIDALWIRDICRHADHFYLRRIQLLPFETMEYPQPELKVQHQFVGRLFGLKSERFRFQGPAPGGSSNAKDHLVGEKTDPASGSRNQSEARAVGPRPKPLESLESGAGGRSQQVDRDARRFQPDGLNP